jgi:hypothetical protein
MVVATFDLRQRLCAQIEVMEGQASFVGDDGETACASARSKLTSRRTSALYRPCAAS